MKVIVSGYINSGKQTKLNGTISGTNLKENRTINYYNEVNDDILYRLEIGEGLDESDAEEAIGEEELPEDFYEFADDYIMNNSFEIESVDFTPYYEYEDAIEGYDYYATISLEWETVWEAYKNKTE